MSAIFMDLLSIALLLVMAYRATIVPKGQDCLNSEYLTLKSAKSLRGIFAIVVLFCHLAKNTTSGVLFRLNAHVGCLAVAVFFFLSGYGLQKQFLNKDNYQKGFLGRRLIPIVMPYIFISIIYWIMFYTIGYAFSAREVLALFLIGEPIAWYSWYILCILLYYFVFWILMLRSKKRPLFMILGSIAFCVVHMLFCNMMGWSSWWYNSVHLLFVGVFWAIYEKTLLPLLEKKYFIICFIAITLFIALFALEVVLPGSIGLSMCFSLMFVISVIVVALKIKIGNPILEHLGENSMEIYMCHGLFVLSLRSDVLYIKNDFLYAIIVIAGTLVFAHLFHAVNKWALSKLKMAMQKKQNRKQACQ